MTPPERGGVPFEVLPGGREQGREVAFKRRLMAVMFTDIKNFSAMMGENEERTMRAVQRHRKVVRSSIEQFEGKEHETIGDAFVVLFESAVNAVNCAWHIQQALQAENQQHPREEQVWIRIGVHLGEVLFTEEGDIFGDNVNIAARAEPQAEPGGICVTDAVASQCRGRVPLGLKPLGRRPMKNIKEPPELFAVVPEGQEGTTSTSPTPTPPAPQVSFRRSRWTWAAAAAGLVLVASSILFRFALTPGPAKPQQEQISASVPPEATDVRVDSNAPVAASTQSVPIFSADAMAQKRFQMACDAYLTGHFDTAEREFKAGLSLDASAPLAHLLLSDIYYQTGREDAGIKATETVYSLTASATANKDVKTLSAEFELIFYAVAGYSKLQSADDVDWSFSDFVQRFPEMMLAYVLWGNSLVGLGDCERAVKAFDRCIEKDPSVVMAFIGKARCAMLKSDWEGVLKVVEEASRWHPDSSNLLHLSGEALFLLGRTQEAFERVGKAVELDPGLWNARMSLAAGYVLDNRIEDSRALLESMQKPEVPLWVRLSSRQLVASVLAGKGHLRDALGMLGEAEKEASRSGELLKAWQMLYQMFMWDLQLRQWEAASQLLDEMRVLVSDVEFPQFAKNYRLLDITLFSGLLAVERGDLQAASDVLARMEKIDPELLPMASRDSAVEPLKWRLLAARGQFEEAFELVRVKENLPTSSLPLCERRRNQARVALLAGWDDKAAAALDGLLGHKAFCSAFLDSGLTVGQALSWRAQLAHKTGDETLADKLETDLKTWWPDADPEAALLPSISEAGAAH